MNKLIINFERGHYSPVKDDFKKIFSGKFKWDKKQSWVGKDGYIKASKKMESGEAITFLIECKDKLNDKFIEFCKENKISYQSVEDFDNINVVEAKIEPERKIERLDVKLDSASEFKRMSQYRKDLSLKFIERWAKLLEEDDYKFNNKKDENKEESMFL